MNRLLALTVVLSIAVLGSTAGQTAYAKDYHQGHINYHDQAQRAVCHFFRGSLCVQAMAIANCETGGTYYPWASNGQYYGIFQMGSQERSIYGDGNNVWAQSKAAYAYYRHSGWGPWLNYEPPECAR